MEFASKNDLKAIHASLSKAFEAQSLDKIIAIATTAPYYMICGAGDKVQVETVSVAGDGAYVASIVTLIDGRMDMTVAEGDLNAPEDRGFTGTLDAVRDQFEDEFLRMAA